jgi:hypothetical protein
MSDADNTQNRGLTTEQLAAAGTGHAREGTPAGHGYDDAGLTYDDGAGHSYDDDAGSLGTDLAAPGHADRDMPDGNVAAGTGQPARLLDEGELQSITMRWKDIQAEFVDEPKTAVQEADALVAELMQRLAAMFATERAELEDRWAGGNEVSTEELRQGLRLYHSFFERLLAA